VVAPGTVEARAVPSWVRSGVPLAPLGNEHIVGVATGRLLDAAQCAAVVTAVEAAPVPPAPERVDASGSVALLGAPLPIETAQWLLPLLGQAVTVANNQHFRFELTGLLAHDPPVVVRMGPDDSDVAGPTGRLFSDLLPTASTRKLTVVLPLSDGSGGVPEFPALGKAGADPAGELSIFPSYLSYRLGAVAGEPRWLLWARVHGPHFQ
jgi:hypothetical protein